ncbi:hypothetical protein ACWEN6_39155 [Sphaerisporangium sp. NPDC004334]
MAVNDSAHPDVDIILRSAFQEGVSGLPPDQLLIPQLVQVAALDEDGCLDRARFMGVDDAELSDHRNALEEFQESSSVVAGRAETLSVNSRSGWPS